MKTIKLNNNQAEIVYKAISAYIREEERDQLTAGKLGYPTIPYEQRIKELKALKTKFE